MGRRAQADARQARKMERATRHTFSSEAAGARGMSIIEMIEERLAHAADRYVAYTEELISLEGEEHTIAEWGKLEAERAGKKGMLRGEIRGEVISLAMMKHPLRRYETAWWNWVKKREKRAVAEARSRVDGG